jgi:hypothetical protein
MLVDRLQRRAGLRATRITAREPKRDPRRPIDRAGSYSPDDTSRSVRDGQFLRRLARRPQDANAVGLPSLLRHASSLKKRRDLRRRTAARQAPRALRSGNERTRRGPPANCGRQVEPWPTQRPAPRDTGRRMPPECGGRRTAIPTWLTLPAVRRPGGDRSASVGAVELRDACGFRSSDCSAVASAIGDR